MFLAQGCQGRMPGLSAAKDNTPAACRTQALRLRRGSGRLKSAASSSQSRSWAATMKRRTTKTSVLSTAGSSCQALGGLRCERHAQAPADCRRPGGRSSYQAERTTPASQRCGSRHTVRQQQHESCAACPVVQRPRSAAPRVTMSRGGPHPVEQVVASVHPSDEELPAPQCQGALREFVAIIRTTHAVAKPSAAAIARARTGSLFPKDRRLSW